MSYLMEILESECEQDREIAMGLFLELFATPKAEQLQNIVTQLDRPEIEVKLTVLNLLKRFERPLEDWVVSRVQRLLQEEVPQVRCAAIACLRKHDASPDTVLHFFHCLHDKSPEVRAVAWEALDEIFLHADFRLADYLNHGSAQIREAARRLLLDHGHEDLIEKVDSGCWRYD